MKNTLARIKTVGELILGGIVVMAVFALLFIAGGGMAVLGSGRTGECSGTQTVALQPGDSPSTLSQRYFPEVDERVPSDQITGLNDLAGNKMLQYPGNAKIPRECHNF